MSRLCLVCNAEITKIRWQKPYFLCFLSLVLNLDRQFGSFPSQLEALTAGDVDLGAVATGANGSV